jgi:hypothetical protein
MEKGQSLYNKFDKVLIPLAVEDRCRSWYRSTAICLRRAFRTTRVPRAMSRPWRVAALLWAVSRWAQTTYRSTMQDGRVIFGNKPASGVYN